MFRKRERTNHERRPEKRENPRFVRVAVVQFNYQPSAVLYYPFLEEPALLAEGEQGITSLHLTVPGFEQQLMDTRQEVSEAYKEFICQRTCEMVNHLEELNVDLVVFPEYSIPPDCLPFIDYVANDLVVIAASHTVTPESIQLLEKLGVEVNRDDDIGKSVCPIRLNTGKWLRIDKLTKSKRESSLKEGSVWHSILINPGKDDEWSFAVFLCIDFINDNHRNLQAHVPRDIWSQVDFGIVPSYSPVVRDFQQKARPVVERAGVPILYSNVASVGGSCIYCHFSEQGTFATEYSTKPLASGDEAVVVVDLKVGQYSQVEFKPTPLPVPESSRLVSVLPLLHKKAFSSFCDLSERIQEAEGDEKKRALAANARENLLSLASSPDIPEILRSKIFDLLSGMSWQSSEGLDNCVDYIPLKTDTANLSELRFALLHRSQKLLAGFVNDVRLKGSEINLVTSVLNVYRRFLDALRPYVRPEVLNKYEITSVQTLSPDKKEGTFTSVFLLRLHGARTDREALEKQIQLLTTIAYKGNENLALNLRYTSIPNPTANLKDLYIDIIGAAKSDDPAYSKEVADVFRRDLVNLIRVTLHNVYLMEVVELETDSVLPVTEPFHFNFTTELSRKVEYGTQPYIDRASSPVIHHLEGSSTFFRILNLVQSSPFACMISVHLRPCKLTKAEQTFFRTYYQAGKFNIEPSEGAMFYLGTERNPALQIPNVAIMRRMLGDTEGLTPNLFARLFVTSDVPLSQLLVNTVGSELWGNDTYQIHCYDRDSEEHEEILRILRLVWADTIFPKDEPPENLERIPYLFDAFEASRMFRLPLEGFSGAVGTLFSLLPAPAAVLPEEGIELGLGFHPGAQKSIVVRLSDRERTKHTYVVGKTGTGKSTLLGRMIEQDIENGNGVCVIDPHGDLVESVLKKIPESRIDDVILFDPASTDMPFGLNLLEYSPDSPHHKDFVVQETISIIRKLTYFQFAGPVFEHNLRHLTLTMMDESLEGQGTLIEVPLLLTDLDLRDSIVPNLQDELAKEFWNQYKMLSAHHIGDQLFYVVSKFDTFKTDRIMRNIIGQSRSTINLSEVVNSQKILLVKLPSAVIGDINSTLLGMIIISKLRWAGMRRSSVHPSDRKDYYIYVDEFQNFAASGFETILAEARKYGLGLTVAHQNIGQLRAFNVSTGGTEDKISQAIFGNAGTMVVFRVGVSDAEFLVKELGPPAELEDLTNIKNYHALVKTLIDNEVYPPFTIKTILSPIPDYFSSAEKIRLLSLEKYGRPQAEVEQEIKDRLQRFRGSG